MLNGGGAGRLINWQLKSNTEIMCLFLSNDEAHKATLASILGKIKKFDNLMGKDVGFLLFFPRKNVDQRSEDDDFEALKDLISNYKPSVIAEGHVDEDIVQSVRDKFGIRYEELPAMLVFSRGFPDRPLVYQLPADLMAQDLEDWFKQLRKISENIKEAPKFNYRDIPLDRLERAIQSAHRSEIEIDKRMKKLADVLTDLANRHHLPRRAKWLLSGCLQVNTDVSEALAQAFVRIFRDLPEQNIAKIENDRGYLRIKTHAKVVRDLVMARNEALNIYGDWEHLDRLVEFEQQKADKLFAELSNLRLRNMKAHLLHVDVREAARSVNSIRSGVEAVIRLVLSVKKLAGLVITN
jgi:hypothetical protein